MNVIRDPGVAGGACHRVRRLRARHPRPVWGPPAHQLPRGVADDRIVEVVLEGSSTLAVTVVLTPRTASTRAVLLDGQPVILSAVNASKVVVEIEGRD